MDREQAHQAFARAVELAGSQSALERPGVLSQQVISYRMKKRLECPAEAVLWVEERTGVSRHELRPDLYPRDESQPALDNAA